MQNPAIASSVFTFIGNSQLDTVLEQLSQLATVINTIISQPFDPAGLANILSQIGSSTGAFNPDQIQLVISIFSQIFNTNYVTLNQVLQTLTQASFFFYFLLFVSGFLLE